MKRRSLLTVAGTAVVALLLALPAQAARTEVAKYYGVVGDAFHFCQFMPDDGIDNLGGACFTPEPGETSVSVTVDDAAGWAVGVYYEMRSAQRDELGSPILLDNGIFCGSATLAIPAGTVSLDVFLDTVLGPLDCGPDSPGVATTGEITAVFS